MNELFLVCYEQDILCSDFFSLYNFSFTHTEEQYKVHNAFISLEYLVKIVRKLMQQMFECFDNFKKYKKKAHIAHLCHCIPFQCYALQISTEKFSFHFTRYTYTTV